MTRNRHSSSRLFVSALTLAAAAFGAGTALAGQDSERIHACASNSNGSLRLVTSASACRSNEQAVEWSKESAIPTPQACPAGQFVTGIDSGGNLTCATPGATGGGGGGGGGGGSGCPDPLPSLPNAITGCTSSGVVIIHTCNAGYLDLNGIVTDGCEYGPILNPGPEVCDGLDNDADGVVDEGIVPFVPNGAATCVNGTLVVTCNSGFADQNGLPEDGCEVTV